LLILGTNNFVNIPELFITAFTLLIIWRPKLWNDMSASMTFLITIFYDCSSCRHKYWMIITTACYATFLLNIKLKYIYV
jgi:hypothetical protein